MPSTGSSRHHRPSWPLVIAWLLAVGNAVVITSLPESAAHRYGLILFGVALGALTVVVSYARLLTRRASPVRAVVLVGGPCDGRLLLNPSSEPPDELWLASGDGSICTYRVEVGTRPGTRLLRYQHPDPLRPVPGL